MEDFYKTGIEIWAGFGPIWQLLRPVFSCFHEQKINSKNIVDFENIGGLSKITFALKVPFAQEIF